MPFYEYTCTACGKPTTVLQKVSDPPATDCPACGQAALTKQISAAGFRLKGAGWYETDFKSGDNKKNLVGDKAGGEKSGDKADSKSGDKPAASPAESGPSKKAESGGSGAAKPAASPASTPAS